MAKSHTSLTESIPRSCGAWRTMVVDPTTHKAQPRTPKICSLSCKIICASTALQYTEPQSAFKACKVANCRLANINIMPDNYAECTKWGNKNSWCKCISCKICYFSYNHCIKQQTDQVFRRTKYLRFNLAFKIKTSYACSIHT